MQKVNKKSIPESLKSRESQIWIWKGTEGKYLTSANHKKFILLEKTIRPVKTRALFSGI
jgi:hypothetical protein